MTAKKILNRKGFPCTLYMGVKMEQEAGKEAEHSNMEPHTNMESHTNMEPHMVAHAWLRCGNIFVSGGDGSREYTVTAIYGDRVE